MRAEKKKKKARIIPARALRTALWRGSAIEHNHETAHVHKYIHTDEHSSKMPTQSRGTLVPGSKEGGGGRWMCVR